MSTRQTRYYIEPIEEPTPSQGGCFWNLMSTLLVLAIFIFLFISVLIYQNPYSRLNPFPPAALTAVEILPTATVAFTATLPVQDVFIPPVTTASVQPSRTPDAVAEPTHSAAPSATPAVNSNTEGKSDFPFVQQPQPSAIQSTVLFSERGCDWMGVGGQVTDLQGRPYKGITVEMGGKLNGIALYDSSVSGDAPAYGAAGFEFGLSDHPLDSQGHIWLRLVDQKGNPLSDMVFIDTFKQCSQNLIIVNFRQVK